MSAHEHAHEHAWKAVAHIDGCHYYSWAYKCACGATASTYAERDVKADPYSFVWMAPDEGNDCPRCAELIAGAKPKHERNVTEAPTRG